MTTQSETRFYIMRQGALKEELLEWDEIVSMCEHGHLTPDTLVFLNVEQEWKKVIDTELERYFDDSEAHLTPDIEPVEVNTEERDEQYSELLGRIAESPDNWSLRLQAADFALAAGDRQGAIEQYQAALDAKPYHPRVANDAVRNLTADEQKALRNLKQVGPFWEEPLVLLKYPFQRSYIYPAVLAALLWLSTLATVARFVGGFIAFLWMFHVIRAVASKERRPPMWDVVTGDIVGGLLKPVGALIVLFAEILVPILAFLQILASAGMIEEPNAFAYINESPMLSVGIFTFCAVYLPGAMMLMAGSSEGVWHALNPKRVISAIGVMEVDYMVAVALFFVIAGIGAAIGAVTWRIPIAGTLPTAVVEAYLFLVMGCALGLLHGRFKDRASS